MGRSAIPCVNDVRLVAAILLLTSPALAEENNSTTCANQDNGYSLNQQIDGCTAVILSSHPSKKYLASVFYLRGKAYHELQEYDRAIADYNEVMRLDPEFPLIFFRRGLAFCKSRDYDRAIADFSQSIKLSPLDTQSYTRRGLAYWHKRDYDRAIADHSKAISIDPKLAFAFGNRGDVYFDKQDYDRALADYSEAIRLDPRNVGGFSGRGAIYSLRQDYKRAISDYSEAIRLDPKDVHSVLKLYLARARSDSDAPKALAALAVDAKNLNQGEWPYPIVELFLGLRTAEAALSASTSSDSRCEAQSYIGEWRLLHGDSAALGSLKEASDACSASSAEYAPARTSLAQLRQDINMLSPPQEAVAPRVVLRTSAKPDIPKEQGSGVGAAHDGKTRPARYGKQTAPDFVAIKDRVTCAIAANIGKLTSLFFDKRDARSKRKSHQCE
jgi:tetratricopeptide (TPR) repeat protein